MEKGIFLRQIFIELSQIESSVKCEKKKEKEKVGTKFK